MVNIKLTRRARDYLMRRMSKKKDDEEGGFVEESPRGAAMRTSMSGKVAPEGMYMPPPFFFSEPNAEHSLLHFFF